ncbi:MAG: carbohydrate ABC transporter permease [Actinomycetota bacterium]|nr:carbohydrate ABC transporter permease [Actinomycetota bacterium]
MPVSLALVGTSIAFLLPFAWLVSASLKTNSEVFNSEWIPSPMQWANYLEIFRVAPVARWLWNSLLVGGLAAATVTFSSALVAFAFAYFRFRGRNALFALVLATMMLPGAVTMVPVFLIWDWLGWVNTHVPLWAHNMFGSAFYVFMLRQFFLGLPRDLFEAARVDGATYFQMWRKIALPLTKPALIVVALFEFKASWTDLIKPLIYLHDASLFTMPLGLKALLDQFGQAGILAWNLVMAASVIITIPMVVLFFLGQRHFVEGAALTGRKG